MSGDDSCSSNQKDENTQFKGKNKHQMLHVPSFVVQIKQSYWALMIISQNTTYNITNSELC